MPLTGQEVLQREDQLYNGLCKKTYEVCDGNGTGEALQVIRPGRCW
jgi:hypothetical protein